MGGKKGNGEGGGFRVLRVVRSARFVVASHHATFSRFLLRLDSLNDGLFGFLLDCGGREREVG